MGFVEHKNEIYTLKQDAYLTGELDNKWYEALARKNNKEYLVKWFLLNSYNPNEQEEDFSCDWANPSEIIYLGEI